MVDKPEPGDDLSAALHRLPREIAPPAHVRETVRSHVRPGGRSGTWRWAVAASLVIAAFAAGRVTAPRPTTVTSTDQKFAFLLYGGPTGAGDDRAEEYGAWVMAARRQGRPVSGERLADTALVAGVPMPEPAPVRGFFIVRARDASEALDLARRHPHARDGTVVVRPIDTP